MSDSQISDKNIVKSLAFLKLLLKDHDLVDIQTEYDFNECKLLKQKSGFELTGKSSSSNIFELPEIKDIEIRLLNLPETKIIIERTFLYSYSPPYFKSELWNIKSSSFCRSTPKYYRFVIPIQDRLSFFFLLKDELFSVGYYNSRGLIKVRTDNLSIDVFTYLSENQWYLIFDSIDLDILETFSNKFYATNLALRFITGKSCGGEGVFFGYDSESMDNPTSWMHVNMNSTSSTIYKPIYSNAFGFGEIRDKDLAEKLNQELEPLSKEIFSALCEKLYLSNRFSSIFQLFLESTQGSLLSKPAGYSVVLEGLTELIADEFPEKTKPIPNKADSKRVIKSLKENLNQLEQYFPSESSFSIFTKKIENINSPTNRSKLMAPFEILQIKILEEDIKCINFRNDFLHGRITLDSLFDEDEQEKRVFSYLSYVSKRLFVLISSLVLRYVGYKGYIVNYPKLHESETGIILEEDFYKKI